MSWHLFRFPSNAKGPGVQSMYVGEDTGLSLFRFDDRTLMLYESGDPRTVAAVDRAVACVNACSCIEDPTTALGEVRQFLHNLSYGSSEDAKTAARLLFLLGGQ